MKALSKILLMSVFLTFASSMSGQSKKSTEKITITIEENGRYQIQSNSEKNSLKIVEIADDSNLRRLGLAAGTVLSGDYTVESFASDGGLGTTRTATGILEFTSVTDGKGNQIGCPPFCDKNIEISFVVE